MQHRTTTINFVASNVVAVAAVTNTVIIGILSSRFIINWQRPTLPRGAAFVAIKTEIFSFAIAFS